MDLQKSILWRNNEEDNGGIKRKGIGKPLGILVEGNIHNICVYH